MIYAYAKVVEAEGIWGLEPTEWNDLDLDWGPGLYSRFHKVTNAHPGLKVRFFAIDSCTIIKKMTLNLRLY